MPSPNCDGWHMLGLPWSLRQAFEAKLIPIAELAAMLDEIESNAMLSASLWPATDATVKTKALQ